MVPCYSSTGQLIPHPSSHVLLCPRPTPPFTGHCTQLLALGSTLYMQLQLNGFLSVMSVSHSSPRPKLRDGEETARMTSHVSWFVEKNGNLHSEKAETLAALSHSSKKSRLQFLDFVGPLFSSLVNKNAQGETRTSSSTFPARQPAA